MDIKHKLISCFHNIRLNGNRKNHFYICYKMHFIDTVMQNYLTYHTCRFQILRIRKFHSPICWVYIDYLSYLTSRQCHKFLSRFSSGMSVIRKQSLNILLVLHYVIINLKLIFFEGCMACVYSNFYLIFCV